MERNNMIDDNDFLDSVVNENNAEYTILYSLNTSCVDKSFLFQFQNIDIIKDILSKFVDFLNKIYKSYEIRLITIKEDAFESAEIQNPIGKIDSIEFLINEARKISEENNSYVFVKTNTNFLLVKKGEIAEKSIDASVRRILSLKEKRGILDMDTSGKDLETKIAEAGKIVGSDEHHAIEKEIAKQAVTLLKNENGTLPVSGKKNILFIGYSTSCSTPISYALSQLKQEGGIAGNTRIENRIAESVEGNEDADTNIVIDYFYKDGEGLAGFDRLSEEIRKADVVICLSSTSAGNEPLVQLQDDYYIMKGVDRALSETHAAGAQFVLLSANIPMDTARFTDADAIICAYLGVGFDIDPTARTSGLENVRAFNANVPAAISALFGPVENMTGKLPIDIPVLEKGADGKWTFTDQILYRRGWE